MNISLLSQIRYLKGVGPALGGKLEAIGITRIIDLLFHLPRDYQDRTRITSITAIRAPAFAQIEGLIQTINIVNNRRRSLIITIDDGSATLQMRLFHFNQSQQQSFNQGRVIRCFGEVRYFNQGLEMIHPEYQLDPKPLDTLEKQLTAIYPTTDGISQKLWRNLQDQALAIMKRDTAMLNIIVLPDHLQRLNITLSDALIWLHRPDPTTPLSTLIEGKHPYQQRLAFEELLAHQLSLIKFRHKRQHYQAPTLRVYNTYSQSLLDALPFQLTAAQQSVVTDIDLDVKKGRPMLRLIQGDVGSGKTIVAALACCAALNDGLQSVVMAPTEILAEQHFENFKSWFEPLNINVTLLLGRHTKKQKSLIYEALLSGKIQLLIGTHAVIEDAVVFHHLGLIIIDEQHRFGVHQRLALKNKTTKNAMTPHQLIMTATPIPRTLAMTAYADLDLSVIDELPPGRQPVQTLLVDQLRREEIMQRITHLCDNGQQAYWVCTLIDESEALNCKAAEKTFEELTEALPQLSLGLVHGRLKAKEKADIMNRFISGEINLLVATTVIEVGVNVPAASIMVIENPERLGLSQLHQLRGRVGRGSLQSYCILLYQSPLSFTAKSRLQVLRDTNDGFIIAEKDLMIRGPGDVLGERQTGLVNLRIADLQRDKHLLEDVQDFAKILSTDQKTVDALINRWLLNPDYFIDG